MASSPPTWISQIDKKNTDLIAQSFKDLKVTSDKLSETNVQLERSNFDLMQFASVASHDLKEPLRKIQAFGNILQSKIKNKLSEGEQNYFSKIISASNRMQSLNRRRTDIIEIVERQFDKRKN